MEDSIEEQVEQAESKLMRDMAFMKMQHQQLVEQLKNNYNIEVGVGSIGQAASTYVPMTCEIKVPLMWENFHFSPLYLSRQYSSGVDSRVVC